MQLLWQVALMICIYAVAIIISAAIEASPSYEIEVTDQMLSVRRRLWRWRWQRIWPRHGIRKISRWGRNVIIRGQRGFRSAGIHGRRSDIKWLHRRLCELLLPDQPSAQERCAP